MCGLNKKPDFLYFFQKLEQKGKKSSQFWVVIFQFHVCNKWKDIMIKSAIIYMDVLKYQVLFPKGEFLRTHRVGPLGLNGFLHLVLFFRIFHSYEPCPLFSGWWMVGGGWWVGGRIFWSNFDFFQSCLEVVLKLFGHCFWTQRAHTCVYIDPKNFLVTTNIEIFWWKFGNFFKTGTRDFTILGAKKVVFWTFCKLFWGCSEVVWGLFLAKAQF